MHMKIKQYHKNWLINGPEKLFYNGRKIIKNILMPNYNRNKEKKKKYLLKLNLKYNNQLQ